MIPFKSFLSIQALAQTLQVAGVNMLIRCEIYVAEVTAREGWYIRVGVLDCRAAKLFPLYSGA